MSDTDNITNQEILETIQGIVECLKAHNQAISDLKDLILLVREEAKK